MDVKMPVMDGAAAVPEIAWRSRDKGYKSYVPYQHRRPQAGDGKDVNEGILRRIRRAGLFAEDGRILNRFERKDLRFSLHEGESRWSLWSTMNTTFGDHDRSKSARPVSIRRSSLQRERSEGRRTNYHPDLILMDIHMPGESGTDAALEIKQDPAHERY